MKTKKLIALLLSLVLVIGLLPTMALADDINGPLDFYIGDVKQTFAKESTDEHSITTYLLEVPADTTELSADMSEVPGFYNGDYTAVFNIPTTYANIREKWKDGSLVWEDWGEGLYLYYDGLNYASDTEYENLIQDEDEVFDETTFRCKIVLDYFLADTAKLPAVEGLTYSDSVTYAYLRYTNTVVSGVPCAIIIQIGEVSVTPQTVDKTALAEAIASAPTSGYYDSGDRYNGKTTSVKGFWADMRGIVNDAYTVYCDTNATQEAVDAATATLTGENSALAAAIANLIPKAQINPTALYEAVKAEKDRNLTATTYTTRSWADYSGAVTAADDYLTGLFNGTYENVAANQGVATAYITAMDTAFKGLYKQELFEQTQAQIPELKTMATTVFKAINKAGLTSTNYTNWDDFSTAYVAAEAMYSKPFTFTGASSERNDLSQCKSAFSSLFTYWLLLQQSGPITVTLTVNDNYGVDRSECYLTEPDTATFCGEITLADGHHSIEDLSNTRIWNNSNAYYAAGAEYLIYVNGMLVRNPFSGNVPRIQGENKNYVDELGIAQLEHDRIQLHNGDDIVIIRVSKPQKKYYIHDVPLEKEDFDSVIPYLSLLRFTTDATKLTPKEGETFTLNLTEQAAYWSAYGGRTKPAAGKEIIFYGPRQEDGHYPAKPIRTGFFTDDAGNVTLQLDKAGTYALAAMDTSGMDITNMKYPGLAGGAHLTVTVSPLSPAELTAKKNEFAQKLDALLTTASITDYETENWNKLPGIISDGKTAVQSTSSLQELQDAYDAAEAAFYAVPVIDHAGIIGLFTHYLDYLPNVAQIKAGQFTKIDQQRMGWLMEHYASLSDYQKTLLTGEQIAHYNALVTAFGADGSNLPEAAEHTVTLKVDDWSLLDDYSLSKTIARVTRYGQDGMPTVTEWSVQNNLQNNNESLLCRFDEGPKGDEIEITVLVKSSEANRLAGIVLEGADYESCTTEQVLSHRQGTTTFMNVKYTFRLRNPYCNFTVHVKAVQGELELAKAAASKALNDARNDYIRSEYTAEGWNALVTACNEGLNAIAAAEDTDAVDAAKKDALDAMKAVEKKPATSGDDIVSKDGLFNAGKEVGTVTVTVENTTYDRGAYKGVFINKPNYPIGENDNMMTVILRALADEDFGWEGTGGSGYGISYLAQIYHDDNGNGVCDEGEVKLGEFSDEPESGWMGCLNDFMVNEGFNMFTAASGQLSDGDVISVMYTENLGVDLGGTWGNSDTTLKDLEVSTGEIVPTFTPGSVGGTHEFALVISGSSANVKFTPHATNRNYLVKTFLNEKVTTNVEGGSFYKRTVPVPVRNGDTVYIGVGENAWPSMNKVGAEARAYSPTWYALRVVNKNDGAGYVNELISKLPAVKYSNYKDVAAQVEVIEAVTKALSAGEQAKVNSLEAVKEKIDGYKKIDNVKGLLAALPKEEGLSDAAILALQDDIERADAAYKDLTKEQQNYITVGDAAKYNALQKRLEKLKPDTTAQFIVGGSGGEKKDKKDEEGNAIAAAEVTVAAEVVDGKATAEVSAEDVTAALTEAGKDADTLTVKVETEGANIVAAGLPADAVKAAADAGVGLNVETENGTVKVDADTLAEAAKGGKAVAVTVTENADGTTTVGVTAGGKAVEADVKIELEAKDGQMLVVVGPDGAETPVILSATEEGTVYAKVPAGSTVKVVDAEGKDFGDVKVTDWFAEAVEFVSSHGIFEGTGEGFEPGTTMNRAMLAMVLYRIDGATGGGTSTFADVKPEDWFADAVAWAADAGIVNGRGEGFAPDAPVTREEIATMLYRFVQYLGVDVSGAADLSKFPDGNKTSEWAGDAMAWAVSVGLFKGDDNGALNPGGEATRAEVATLVERLVKLLVK